MDDGVYAVGGVVGLRIRKRNGTIRYLMRWTRHGVRHDYYLPRDILLTEARKLAAECRCQLFCSWYCFFRLDESAVKVTV